MESIILKTNEDHGHTAKKMVIRTWTPAYMIDMQIKHMVCEYPNPLHDVSLSWLAYPLGSIKSFD